MAPTETQTLNDIKSEVIGLRSDMRVLHTKMFGADDSENAQGRIPRIEAIIVDHECRLQKQERLESQGSGALWVIARIFALLGVLVGLSDLAYRIFTNVRH